MLSDVYAQIQHIEIWSRPLSHNSALYEYTGNKDSTKMQIKTRKITRTLLLVTILMQKLYKTGRTTQLTTANEHPTI